MRTLLVTGGAGYIGSHTCVELLDAGHEVVVVTSGAIADVVNCTAKTDPNAGTRGISCFLVEKGTEGFSSGQTRRRPGTFMRISALHMAMVLLSGTR